MELTIQDIENRNYSYVHVRLLGFSEFRSEKFLVPTKYKKEALEMAKLYVARNGWEVLPNQDSTRGDSCRCCGCYYIYPRNYVKESRTLFDQKKFYVEEEK